MLFMRKLVGGQTQFERKNFFLLKRFITNSNWEEFLTTTQQKGIESEWNQSVSSYIAENQEILRHDQKKKYILSMFPYPSGNLHMGHVRVYTISDAMARFYHMKGWKVIHPMGWDAFGLPAENAAIEMGENPQEWTKNNVEKMRKRLKELGCGFNWWSEIMTCDPQYYKWTQFIFLKLYHSGLVYRKEAMVNWDPVDETVLANEQVDENGCSWRSGAKVEKKMLTQWFIKATSLSKDLYDDLSDPSLENWNDITLLQKHWIGECNGYITEMKILDRNENPINTLNYLPVWMTHPEYLENIAFLAVKSDHLLNKDIYKHFTKNNSTVLNVKAVDPVSGRLVPIIVNDGLNYEEGADVYVGIPSLNGEHKTLCSELEINIPNAELNSSKRTEIISKLKDSNMGGYESSAKLKDWLISRQRYWGTPIPIVYCTDCGTVPVPDNNLPVELPRIEGPIKKGMSVLKDDEEWLHCPCPRCGKTAQRETDTMDTFVDSSWYFLRYLDAKNEKELIDKDKARTLMPVDLYIGGKEHAILHLYYARFMHKFLTKIGLATHKEPFKKLLVQGFIKSKSFKVKKTGKYLRPDEVDFSVSPPVEKESRLPLVIEFEKMSKSKHNGIDPQSLLDKYGTDAVRLATLSNAGPQTERNWNSEDLFHSFKVMNKLWLVVRKFVLTRREGTSKLTAISEKEHIEHQTFLFETRNRQMLRVSNFMEMNFQFHSAIRCIQEFIRTLQKIPSSLILSDEYEKSLRCILLVLTPICPHLTAELWQRINDVSKLQEYKESAFILDHPWPLLDTSYKIELFCEVNEERVSTIRVTQSEFKTLTKEKAMKLARGDELLSSLFNKSPILKVDFSKATLSVFTKTPKEIKMKKKTTRNVNC